MATSDSAPPPTAPEHASTLDARSREIIGGVIRLLARNGYDPCDISAEAEKTCREESISWVRAEPVAPSAIEAATQVFTLWFHESAYTDSRGKPRPLSVRGKRSLEALARQAGPNLKVEEVLKHVLRREVLRPHGRRYLPRRRILIFDEPGTSHARGLERVATILRTLAHNREANGTTPKWYERVATNARFPVSKRAEFDKRLEEFLDRMLVRFDTEMHEKADRRKKGEATVGLQIGVYVSEYQRSPPEPPAAPEPRATRERRRKKKSP
jgi:hypothetical protein